MSARIIEVVTKSSVYLSQSDYFLTLSE